MSVVDALISQESQIIATWNSEMRQIMPASNVILSLDEETLFDLMSIQLHSLINALVVRNQKYYLYSIEWIRSILISRELFSDLLLKNMQVMRKAIKLHIPEEYFEIVVTYLNRGEKELEDGLELLNSSTEPDENIIDTEYLSLLLAGDRDKAVKFVRNVIDQKYDFRYVLLRLIQPTQIEIGRLWQYNKINVAQEHLATAINQFVIAHSIYPFLFRYQKKKVKKTILAFCPGDELHELGLRIVTDFFALEGWDTIFLGANTPRQDILEFIKSNTPDLIALSATMVNSVHKLHEAIRDIRQLSQFEGRIMVGGFAFNLDPELYKYIDADGYAADAQRAIELARQWFKY
jgi:methanogenic corrinoid protein MtbC1